MEVKKTAAAMLENKRTTYFLLGLIFVLTLFVVALEYTARDTIDVEGNLLPDEMAQDLEMVAAVDQRDMITAAPLPKQETVSEEIREVQDDAGTEDHNEMKEAVNVHALDESEVQQEDVSMVEAPPVVATEEDNPLNFRVVEQLPEFPGGMSMFVQWLTKRLQYPAFAKQQRIQGKVVVSFIVNKDGSTTDMKVIKTADPILDREALRVLRNMPQWKPGKDKGKPCRTLVSIPIVFKL